MAICLILTLVILSQNPKGGGLSSTFGGGGSQMFGVQRTNDFLDKATWTLAAIIAAVVILANVMLPRTGGQNLVPDIPVLENTLPQATPGDGADAPAQPLAPAEPTETAE
ncbi:preprotein translocase subunit SecG [Weeksellaceae bacterium KMM 9713]|uniref:Protein-export membrane protein SecG n=2 Tax=Profundicola chukchiensis TaxID=2961959 RepID=A0A9X4RV99_9FLAO|nr:preprotein translocase subunit SecG [Profundicola chukchiensis]